jgi:hypothetical protein
MAAKQNSMPILKPGMKSEVSAHNAPRKKKMVDTLLFTQSKRLAKTTS